MKVAKTYPYISELQAAIVQSCLDHDQPLDRRAVLAADDPRWIAPNIVPIPAEATKELVKRRWSRFPDKRLISTDSANDDPVPSTSTAPLQPRSGIIW
jgi:hypothetical protein